MKFNVGDKVICTLVGGKLSRPRIIETEIIDSTCNEDGSINTVCSYIVLIPRELESYIGWDISLCIVDDHFKYKGRKGWYVGEDTLTLMGSSVPAQISGANCVKCNYYNEYAESSLNYVCFNCR